MARRDCGQNKNNYFFSYVVFAYPLAYAILEYQNKP